jgi:hypothetical protein
MISITLAAVGLLIAFGAGVLAATVAFSTEPDTAADAWRYVCAELTRKGWRRITPQLVIALLPDRSGPRVDSTD